MFSSIGDKILTLVVVLIVVVGVALAGLLVFGLIDSAGVPTNKTCATVVEQKVVVPAHTITTMVMMGKVMMPITTSYPESYRIRFKADNLEMSIGVTKNFFDSVQIGSGVQVGLGVGRLSKTAVPVSIESQIERR